MGGCLYSGRRATNNREPWTKIFAIVRGAGEGAHIRNSGNRYDCSITSVSKINFQNYVLVLVHQIFKLAHTNHTTDRSLSPAILVSTMGHVKRTVQTRTVSSFCLLLLFLNWRCLMMINTGVLRQLPKHAETEGFNLPVLHEEMW